MLINTFTVCSDTINMQRLSATEDIQQCSTAGTDITVTVHNVRTREESSFLNITCELTASVFVRCYS